jgi:hypothetical protein
MLGQKVVLRLGLPGDDPEVLADIMTDLHNELQPQGQLEEIPVDRTISCTSRLQRVIRAETSQIHDTTTVI